jgi:hypothetical protein
MQAQWFWTAILIIWGLGVSIPLKEIVIGWAIYLVGYIMGHFFWGTEYKEWQSGNGHGGKGPQEWEQH